MSYIKFRSMCHLGPAIFEDTKRGRSLVKKKATVPPIPGPLIPLVLTPPQQPQRGGRGGARGGVRGGRRGGKKAVVEEDVVEEEVEEEEVVTVFSRTGRPIKPKKR